LPYGSWFLHLLPFIDNKALYDVMANVCATNNRNDSAVAGWTTPPVGSSTTCPCAGYTYNPAVGQSGAVYSVLPTMGTCTGTILPTNYNGHTTPGSTYSYSCVTNPGTIISYSNPGSAANCSNGTNTYQAGDPSGCGPVTNGAVAGTGTPDQSGIWYSQARKAKFPFALCPSDPSPNKAGFAPADSHFDPDVGAPITPPYPRYWGATNYLANWWVFNANIPLGVTCGSGNLFSIPDGSSTTILLAEAYSECDTIGRVALYPDWSHHFGITWTGGEGTGPFNTSPPGTGWGNGMPNFFMFQFQPRILTVAQCPPGADCCNNWTVQTPHVVMNVAMGDASIKPVSSNIMATTWARAMNPNDRQANGPDW
jgi:hypothetical protein